jgi:hypothetical protein
MGGPVMRAEDKILKMRPLVKIWQKMYKEVSEKDLTGKFCLGIKNFQQRRRTLDGIR